MGKLNVNRGTTFVITVNYQQDGVATTLVGATVRFTVKSAEFDADDTDAAAVITKNVTSGTSGGVAKITLNPADTQDIVPGNYFYDVKVQDAASHVYKIDEGKFVLDGSPTNRLV